MSAPDIVVALTPLAANTASEAERIERGRTLFARKIEARVTEEAMRAAQDRRDRREGFQRAFIMTPKQARDRREKVAFARAATVAAGLAVLVAGAVGVLAHYQ